MKYIINIAGDGTTEEIVDALDDIKAHIQGKVERGEEGDLDDIRMDFPKRAPLDKQRFSVLIKLKY
jgi:hypothetical protein